MQHSFDIDIAREYGILEAILLNNLWFWIEKNRANGINYYDDNYWTYNSTRAFNELFPYASQRRIQTALTHLKEEGIITTGNYNKSAYDRTLWYAFTKKGKSIMQKCKMDNANSVNGNDENVTPIPDSKPVKKPSKKPNSKPKEFVPPTLEEVKAYCEKRGNKIDPQYFYDYFNDNEWIDNNGKQVMNWKGKILTWEKYSKEEKKNESNSRPSNTNGSKYSQFS